ncbi:hypothetical protein ACFQ36_13915 [Arthrobacter sp. GCM10027362]|uniref:hypothetical protein n=1 Tax=Arthrobacter sp. GCM10027362 TaxID=3273379 RepID=UPI00363F746F
MPGEIIRFDELAGQRADLLPNRETLFVNVNVAPVIGVNMAFAINAATVGSVAQANAWQQLVSVSH